MDEETLPSKKLVFLDRNNFINCYPISKVIIGFQYCINDSSDGENMYI